MATEFSQVLRRLEKPHVRIMETKLAHQTIQRGRSLGGRASNAQPPRRLVFRVLFSQFHDSFTKFDSLHRLEQVHHQFAVQVRLQNFADANIR